MKTRIALTLLTLGLATAAWAQENDDMYFNSKDRVKVNNDRQVALAKRYGEEDIKAVRNNPVNPSDSYSGRGVNPEYNGQSKNGTTLVQENVSYFIAGYKPKNVNGSLYSGDASNYSSSYAANNCCCNSNGSMFGMNSMSSPFGMYSPYSMYGMGSSMYSPYGMYSPYSVMNPYGPMMASGLSMYGMGGMGGYGMSYGMSYGYGGYGMYPAYGYGYSGASYYTTSGDANTTVNGNHYSRSSAINNTYVDRSRTGNNVVVNSTAGRGLAGGRSSGNSAQANYYDSGWRNNASNFQSTGSFGSGANRGSSWGNSGMNGSSWDSGGRRQSMDSWGGGGGRSSGFSGGGGGGFSGGGSSGGSSGGGSHTRH